jgi:uncharacterized protein YbbC (DUF1343 family)
MISFGGRTLLIVLLLALWPGCQNKSRTVGIRVVPNPQEQGVQTGADVLMKGLWVDLKGKKIALVANSTSQLCNGTSLLDSLVSVGIQVTAVFAPEHGFRGDREAGQVVDSYKDSETGIPVLSLYGKRKAPSQAELQDVDLVIFDIQDVGTRYYTYVSTLGLVMDACAEADIPLWVLDRPNPNGDLAAGPIRVDSLASFVGLDPIPILHGLTIGEYARMAQGEGWHGKGLQLRVVAMQGHTRGMPWESTGLRWVPPSPNLPTLHSARCYPALCWFEGTLVSVGRGTGAPFTQAGSPFQLAMRYAWKKDSLNGQKSKFRLAKLALEPIAFTPKAIAGKAVSPPYLGRVCWGHRLLESPENPNQALELGLELIQNYLNEYAEHRKLYQIPTEPFFNPFFARLAGTATLQKQLETGQTPTSIIAGWAPEVADFTRRSERYRLYRRN